MNLSGFILMSDIDGTLINPDGSIPSRNLEAIARFQAKGGLFGIATGRSPIWTREFARRIGVNVPCVCFNGGTLYDFEREETLMEIVLLEKSKAYVEVLREIPFPVGMIVMTKDAYRNISGESGLVDNLLRLRNSRYTPPEPWQAVDEPWNKLLLIIDEKHYEDCMAFLAARDFPGVRFTVTTYSLIEMLPEEVTKAYALKKLMELTGASRDRIACIGDFYNDLEMIGLAGVGAATAGAPEDVKAAADLVTGPCENGAVADLIEYLEKN